MVQWTISSSERREHKRAAGELLTQTQNPSPFDKLRAKA
jgi:hypothetical protein